MLTVECEKHSSFKACRHEILKYRGKVVFIEISMAIESKHISTYDALALVLEENQSDLSELSTNEDCAELRKSCGYAGITREEGLPYVRSVRKV